MQQLSLKMVVVFLLFAVAVQAQVKTTRLFLIGNSFSQNASRYLPQLSKEAGIQLTIGRAELGGCPLNRHWESVEANDADPNDPKGKPYNGKSLRELLSDGKWNIVTIQQYSLLSGDVETYIPYAERLYAFIKKIQPNAEVVFHQTWAYRSDAKSFGKIKGEERARDQQEMYNYSRASYHYMAKKLGVRIIPSGDAMQMAGTDAKWGFKKDVNFDYEHPTYPALPNQTNSLNVGYSYDKDQKLNFDPNHANDAGCYLAGLVWYKFLFKKDPTKVAFKPEKVSPQFAEFLKQTAKKVVK